MTARRWLPASGAAVLAASAAAGCVSALRHGFDGPVNVPFVVATLALGAAFAGVGALLIGVRSGNILGPLLLGSGAALVVEMGVRELAYDLLDTGTAPTWARAAGWTSSWLDVLGLPLALVFLLLLFPDGRLPSRRWWPLAALTALAGAVRLAAFLLDPGPIRLESHDLDVRWAGPSLLSRTAFDRLDAVTGTVTILALLAAIVSLLVRFARGEADIRRRLTPLALAAATMLVGLGLQSVDPVEPAGVVVFVVGGTLVPVALLVGALRYQVWDLDPWLVRAIVYAGLAVLVTLVYVLVVQGIVLALGRRLETDGLLPAVAATVVVAVLFAPAKERMESAARRLVYGERATPYATLAALPQRLVDAPAVDEVLPATAQSIVDGLGVATAGVAAVLPDGTRRLAWHPEEPERLPEPVAIRHLGAHVGDLYVVPRADQRLTREDQRLLDDLAAQAGPALRAVALAAELEARLEEITVQAGELAASRQRLVVAQSEERRRLQRDLHDGVQQRLVAISMRLAATRMLIGTDAARAEEELAEAGRELGTSLDEIREIARGLHPSNLAARGLIASLRTRAEVSRQPVDVVDDGFGETRLPAEIEAAAYYCCLEALQNAAKHAPSASVRVTVAVTDDELCWSVVDDGPGFDPVAVNGSGGLAGMRARLGELGGTLTVSSGASGTEVRGRIPRA